MTKDNAKPPQEPSPFNSVWGFFSYINDNVMYLNNTKFFAGVVMIMLNIGSKFITIQFSKSTEEYLQWLGLVHVIFIQHLF